MLLYQYMPTIISYLYVYTYIYIYIYVSWYKTYVALVYHTIINSEERRRAPRRSRARTPASPSRGHPGNTNNNSSETNNDDTTTTTTTTTATSTATTTAATTTTTTTIYNI